MVGYNVQSAVDTKHHLIVTHEVTNVGSDRSQLSRMTEQARAAIGSETIEAVADRGYYSGEEIVACEQAGIRATHFQMKTLKNVSTEMALHVLAYNMKRVIRILGVGGLMESIRA
jgi:hypothetical protein